MGAVGCPREAPPARPPEVAPAKPAETRAPIDEYALINPDAQPTVVALGEGAVGVVANGARIVYEGSRARLAKEILPGNIQLAARIPQRLGGGFAFIVGQTLWTATTFDGPLKPIVDLGFTPASIEMAPKSVLFGDSQDRVAVDPRTGKLAPMPLAGVLHIASLDDGRALALTLLGGLFVSSDHGASWREITNAVPGTATGVESVNNELWVSEGTGRAFRVEPDGHVTEATAIPAPTRAHVHARDARWHDRESPLQVALTRGLLLDPATAIVAVNGDVMRVDLASQAVKPIATGKLPPGAQCEVVAMPSRPNEALVICDKPSIVASLSLGDTSTVENPVRIERTQGAAAIFVSDDGGVVLGSPCDTANAQPHDFEAAVCARLPNGDWREHTRDEIDAAIASTHADAGGFSEPEDQVRAVGLGSDPTRERILWWIPRADGAPVALVLTSDGIVSVDLGSSVVTRAHVGDAQPLSALLSALEPSPALSHDWSIDASTGAILGWIQRWQGVTIEKSGVLRTTPFSFSWGSVHGSRGLGVELDRLYQTTDHGMTWTEIEKPKGFKIRSGDCGALGCVLGENGGSINQWARIGYRAPTAEDAAREANAAGPAPAPDVVTIPILEREHPRTLRCEVAGDTAKKTLLAKPIAVPVNGDASPEELDDRGFGATRLPRAFGHGWSRATIARALGFTAVASGSEGSSRGIIGGPVAVFDPTASESVIVPGSSSSGFKRDITLLDPFDPSGRLRTGSFGLPALTSLAQQVGATVATTFVGVPSPDGAVPIVPRDASDDALMLMSFQTALPTSVPALALVERNGDRGATFRFVGVMPEPAVLVGAASGAAGEIYALLESPDATSIIAKIVPGGVMAFGHVPPTPSGVAFPFDNALAIGPKGEVAVLRSPSIRVPPSKDDPALLVHVTGNAPPISLAAWSTLTLASDPACKADVDGYRVTLQPASVWLTTIVRGSPPPDVNSATTVLRLRWSRTRVCLEGVEAEQHQVIVEPATGRTVPAAVVAAFNSAPSASLLTYGVGVEMRQPLNCELLR
jgi:hypothetical protein